MEMFLQWLTVCVFAVLVCVPALAQAQSTSAPTTNNLNWDYYYGALNTCLGTLIGGMLAFCGMWLNRKKD